MQVEAIYDNGRLEFTRSLRLTKKRFKVKVDIPEEQFVAPQPFGIQEPLSDESLNWLIELEKLHDEVSSMPEDQQPVITAKDIERLEAAKMREDR